MLNSGVILKTFTHVIAVSYKGKYLHEVLVICLDKLAQKKDHSYDWDVQPQTQRAVLVFLD